MSTISERLAFVAAHNPAFVDALGGAVAAQANGPLDARTQALVYLGALAALGAEESFRVHLEMALDAGITREEALQAALLTFTAAGVTPLLKVLGAFLDG